MSYLVSDRRYTGELEVCVLGLAVSGDRSYEDAAVIRKDTNEIHRIRSEGGAAIHRRAPSLLDWAFRINAVTDSHGLVTQNGIFRRKGCFRNLVSASQNESGVPHDHDGAELAAIVLW
jgi:hypothetical protein